MRIEIKESQAGRDMTVIAGDYIASLPPSIQSLHQIPPPAPDFTGREKELQTLLKAIETQGATITGLRGMGGVGKTALALKLAEYINPKYPDAQLFLDLRGAHEQTPLTPAEAMAYVLHAFHPEAKLPEDEGEVRGIYQSTLHGQRALLLCDNARDAAQIQPLIPLNTVKKTTAQASMLAPSDR